MVEEKMIVMEEEVVVLEVIEILIQQKLQAVVEVLKQI